MREDFRELREKMERWARWRYVRLDGVSTITPIGRVMKGLPSTKCPACCRFRYSRPDPDCLVCYGTGRLNMDPRPARSRTVDCPEPGCGANGGRRGEIHGRTCHRCHGSGEVVVIEHQINPAFILSTWREPDDRVSQRIDRLVAELRRRDELLGYYFVIWSEFRDPRAGTHKIRAERMHISVSSYEKRLERALEWIGHGLVNAGIPAETLRFPVPKITA